MKNLLSSNLTVKLQLMWIINKLTDYLLMKLIFRAAETRKNFIKNSFF